MYSYITLSSYSVVYAGVYNLTFLGGGKKSAQGIEFKVCKEKEGKKERKDE